MVVATPENCEDVIPVPWSAAITSLKPASSGELTDTLKTAWSGCTVIDREAVSVTVFVSSCPNSSGAASNSKATQYFDIANLTVSEHTGGKAELAVDEYRLIAMYAVVTPPMFAVAALDIARTSPRFTPAALASFCA